MKKALLVLFAIMVVAAVGSAAVAQEKPALKSGLVSLTSVGYIDVQRVFSSYKETQKAQEEYAQKEKEYKKEVETRQEEIEKARREKRPDTEIEALTKKLEEELAPRRQKLLEVNQALTNRIQAEIVANVGVVAKNLGMDLVLDKQVIIVGGIDLTEMVVNKLNEKK